MQVGITLRQNFRDNFAIFTHMHMLPKDSLTEQKDVINLCKTLFMTMDKSSVA